MVADCCVQASKVDTSSAGVRTRTMKIDVCRALKNVVVECFITRIHVLYGNPERGQSVLLGTDDTWGKTDGARCVLS